MENLGDVWSARDCYYCCDGKPELHVYDTDEFDAEWQSEDTVKFVNKQKCKKVFNPGTLLQLSAEAIKKVLFFKAWVTFQKIPCFLRFTNGNPHIDTAFIEYSNIQSEKLRCFVIRIKRTFNINQYIKINGKNR